MPRTGRPPKTDWAKCKVAECKKEARGAKGFCQSHYVAFFRGALNADGSLARPVKRVSSYGPGALCLVPGCLNRPKGRDLCAGHYQQWNDGHLKMDVPNRSTQKMQYRYHENAVCLALDCTLRPINNGMCSKHTQQRQLGILNQFGQQLRPLLSSGRKRKPGPTKDGAGYLLVVAPEGYTGKTRQGRVLQHRLVMEYKLGRPLQEYEIVHHKDGDRTNNSLENLELTTQKLHPPSHEYTLTIVREALESLRHNDPEAYALLMADQK